MTLQQYVNDSISKPCEAVDVYGESTTINVIIEAVDTSVRHVLRSYWAAYPQASLGDIGFRAESLLAVQKGFGNPSPNKDSKLNSKICISAIHGTFATA